MSALFLGSPPGARCVPLPEPRGAISDRVFASLQGPPGTSIDLEAVELPASPLCDDDLQLALYVLYEIHYATVADVHERWEWDAGLLATRAVLEDAFEQALDEAAGEPAGDCEDVGAELQRLVAQDDGPSLSRYMECTGTIEQMRELVVHRSAYQLKEADPHSWAIPRLAGAAKAALLEIQFDEYGEGRAERMHASLFANTMAGLGLDAGYGAYLSALPGITLATVNAMSLFGLHRRRRGALVGHLAAFEMTSSIPNRRYGNALRRLGFGPPVTTFFDEHVQADAVHESIAAWDLAGGLARSEPQLTRDIQFGARALLALEARWGDHLLKSWARGASSLRTGWPVTQPTPAAAESRPRAWRGAA